MKVTPSKESIFDQSLSTDAGCMTPDLAKACREALAECIHGWPDTDGERVAHAHLISRLDREIADGGASSASSDTAAAPIGESIEYPSCHAQWHEPPQQYRCWNCGEVTALAVMRAIAEHERRGK